MPCLNFDLQLPFGSGESFPETAVDGFGFSAAPPFGCPLGVVGWIGDGQTGEYLISPLQELAFQIGNLTFSFHGQVDGFTEVMGDMVEFEITGAVKVFGQFPIRAWFCLAN